jgi:hypothetical protein
MQIFTADAPYCEIDAAVIANEVATGKTVFALWRNSGSCLAQAGSIITTAV